MVCATRWTPLRVRAGRLTRCVGRPSIWVRRPPNRRPYCRRRRPRRGPSSTTDGSAMGFERIAIVGAGAWGTALAHAVARSGRAVTLASRDRARADAITTARASPHLAGNSLEDGVAVATVGAAALGSQDAIL